MTCCKEFSHFWALILLVIHIQHCYGTSLSVNPKNNRTYGKVDFKVNGKAFMFHNLGDFWGRGDFETCSPPSNAHALNKYMKDTLSGFGKWALNEASPPLEDSSLLQNTSYTKIKNPMYNLDLLFTDTKIEGIVSKLVPNCVTTYLEKEYGLVRFTIPNVKISGTFKGNGSLWRTYNFEGSGAWSMGVNISCGMFLGFSNISNSDQLKPLTNITKKGVLGLGAVNVLHCKRQYSPMLKQNGGDLTMESLFQSFSGNESSPDVTGVEQYIKANIKNVLGMSLDPAFGTRPFVLVTRKMGLQVAQYLANALEGKSIFELMNMKA